MKLSNRHLDVLRLYAMGMTRHEIGADLFLSPHTVMNYLAEARQILGAMNSTHAVTLCIARGHLCVDHRTELVYVPRPLDEPEPVDVGVWLDDVV